MARMTLARFWTRRLLAGAATAALTPAVFLAAALAIVFGGGPEQFREIGQVLSGPSLSASGPPAAGLAPTGHATGDPLAALGAPKIIAGRLLGPPGGMAGTTRPPAPTSPGAATPLRPPGRTGTIHPVRPSRPAPGGAPPNRHATLIDGIVGAGTMLSSQLPPPAGAAVTQALNGAGALADRALPPGPMRVP